MPRFTHPRSSHGGRPELGQNFLNHRPTARRIARLVDPSLGAILEIGAGDGALTHELAALPAPITAIELDEHRVRSLRRNVHGVTVHHADALRWPLDSPTVVGNIPFHLTTPILRRLLSSGQWRQAILLTQWEVARKRASVGGGTMLSAQSAPWFEFELHDRVPSWCFTPAPSVDGGILRITRRGSPLVPGFQRDAYDSFVRGVFTGRGGTLTRVVASAARCDLGAAGRALASAGLPPRHRARDIRSEQWAALWNALRT